MAREVGDATKAIAGRIQALRKSRGWSAQRLAQEMTSVGLPWDRQVVAKLESGRRQTISVAELCALAYVFGVPPLVLLFPIRTGGDVEILPGRHLDGWTAARWFMGDVDLDDAWPPTDLGNGPEWEASTAPITLRRKHDRLLIDYELALLGVESWFEAEVGTDQEKRKLRAESLLRSLRTVRGEMRRHGMTPPVLREHHQHVDDRHHVWLTPEQLDAAVADRPGDITMVNYAPGGNQHVVRPGDGVRFRAAMDHAASFVPPAYPDDDQADEPTPTVPESTG